MVTFETWLTTLVLFIFLVTALLFIYTQKRKDYKVVCKQLGAANKSVDGYRKAFHEQVVKTHNLQLNLEVAERQIETLRNILTEADGKINKIMELIDGSCSSINTDGFACVPLSRGDVEEGSGGEEACDRGVQRTPGEDGR